MQTVLPQSPDGQHYLLRSHLREVFARSALEGNAWEACVAAFLAEPGIPILAINGTTQGPASFFLRVFTNDLGEDGNVQPWHAEIRQRLAGLGDQPVTELLKTDETSTWVVFLNDGLNDVLAFGSRRLPEPKYTTIQDEQDISEGVKVDQLHQGALGLRVVKLDLGRPAGLRVELMDDLGRRFEVGFRAFRRVHPPTPENEEIVSIDQIRGATGRNWYVFEPAPTGTGRKLAVQAAEATWTALDA
jgi:hypothetical protein